MFKNKERGGGGRAGVLNELSVIGSLCLHTDFWDRHGCSDVQKNDFRFFAALLSEMDLGNTDSRGGGISFCLRNHVVCSKIFRLTCLHEQGLL